MSRLLEALEAHAGARPRQTAVEDGERKLSWSALWDEVASLAARLEHNPLPLGLFMENGPSWLVSDLAALAAGRTCLPLPGFFSDAQLGHALRDAGTAEVLCDSPETIQRVAEVKAVTRLRVAGRLLFLLRLDRKGSQPPADTAKITYTSGTTGTPRGVPLSLGRLEQTAAALAEAAEAGPEDRALALMPLSILLENIGSLYVPLLAGATLLLPSPRFLGWDGVTRLDPPSLSSALQRLDPTTAILTPELLKLFLYLRRRNALPSGFRFLAVGGAPTPAALVEEAAHLGLPVYQGYGLSEAGSVVTLNRPDANRPGSCGKPLPGMEIRIETNGEILVRGSGFRGYLGHPTADEWLATGDLGHLDEEGFLHVRGRKKQLIINSLGRNISPEWVEAELLAEPEIHQAAVFGEGLPSLVAVLTPAPGVDGSAVEVAVERANGRLPGYAQIGKWIEGKGFHRETGELTANGRLRRNVIHERYRSQLEELHEPFVPEQLL